MRSAEEVAFECVYGMHRRDLSREVFRAILRDEAEMGQGLRKLVAAIAKTIEADRAAQEAVFAARQAGAAR